MPVKVWPGRECSLPGRYKPVDLMIKPAEQLAEIGPMVSLNYPVLKLGTLLTDGIRKPADSLELCYLPGG